METTDAVLEAPDGEVAWENGQRFFFWLGDSAVGDEYEGATRFPKPNGLGNDI